jgi:lipid II:glycine glycyltransferase (peptidoglycan interpeptide bridge formation enzyme)
MNYPEEKKKIKPISKTDYQLFWKENNGAVFQSAEWINLVKNVDEHESYYGYFENSDLVNAFLIVLKKGRFIQTITIPKFTPFLGWIIAHDNSIIISFINDLNKNAAAYCFKDLCPSLPQLITHQIDLTFHEDVLFSNLRQDKKRNIKKAYQQNLKITIESNYEILAGLLECTFERQKHPFYGYKQVQKILDHFSNHFQINVYSETQCLASLLFVYDKWTAYYLIGGFNNSLDNYNAGPFAMWNAILEAKKKELKTFDFEGSSIPSIAIYFKSFGAKEVPYSFFESKKWHLRLLENFTR